MNRARGFTLMELLLALALAALVVVAVGTVVFTFQRRILVNHLVNQQQEVMTRTLYQIGEQLRQATGISLSDPLSINPPLVQASLPPHAPGHEPRTFQFGYQETGGYVWIGQEELPTCPHIEELRLHYDQDRHLLFIQLRSEDTIHGCKQGLPLILETSVILRNAGD